MDTSVVAVDLKACRELLEKWDDAICRQAAELKGKQNGWSESSVEGMYRRFASISPGAEGMRKSADRHWAYDAATMLLGAQSVVDPGRGYGEIYMNCGDWGLNDEQADLLKSLVVGRDPYLVASGELDSDVLTASITAQEAKALADAFFEEDRVDRIEDPHLRNLVLGHLIRALELADMHGYDLMFVHTA
jgi:hypothetical protein